MSKVLIIGAAGQIGSELTQKLREIHGSDNVVASDINYSNTHIVNSGLFEILDAKDFDSVKGCIEKHHIDTVYLMAAMLSATGEKHPIMAWDLNMNSLFHVLNLAKEGVIKKVFWPSSIAVFGPTTPSVQTPQHTTMEPTTVYGITKQVGERWCDYYNKQYGVDVRSIRYPGIISWKTAVILELISLVLIALGISALKSFIKVVINDMSLLRKDKSAFFKYSICVFNS